MATTQDVRKAGDTLILSGSFAEGTPLDLSDWAGASAKINIANSDTGAVVTDHDSVTISAAESPVTYSYEGVMPDVGTYLYEIEVTFANSNVLTWPNDGTKHKLKVIAQLA